MAQRQRSGKAKSDGTGGKYQGGEARQAPVHRHRTGEITPELCHSTAVRVSELASLNIDDIRWSSKDLIVYGKGEKERTVYLNERTNMYLQEYLQSRTDNNPALFVGLKSPHNRLSKAGIEDMIRRTGERAGVEKAHPHRFRGTSITNAINRGMPLQEASIMAGHAKTETTMLYCNVDQESVKYHHKKYLSA